MNKCLKVTIIILMVVIIVSKQFVFAASFEMSEEKLDATIDLFMENLKNEGKELDSETDYENIVIERVNDTIKVTSDGEVTQFKYDFSEACKFYTDVKFTKSMTLEELQMTTQEYIAPIFGFLITSTNKGNGALDSTAYIMFSLLEKMLEDNNFNSFVVDGTSDINGIECMEKFLSQNPGIDTDLYKVEYVKISENSDEAVVRANWTMKPEADYSVVKGAFNKYMGDMNDSADNTNDSKPNKDTGKELPQAGINIALLNTLKVSVFIVAVAIVLLLVKCLKTRECKNEK